MLTNWRSQKSRWAQFSYCKMQSFSRVDKTTNTKFRNIIYHRALFNWHFLDIRTSPNPGRPPNYSEVFFQAIKSVKNEGLLNVSKLGLSQWYKVALENYVTTEIEEEGFCFQEM